MDRQLTRQVPGSYFMITFTVPEAIRRFFRSHQSFAYDAFFKASSEAMKTLAGDEKFIGGDVPGFFGVLHTWGRTLNYHPHIHYVVAGGAWSKADNAWHPSRQDFYVPNKALSRFCRAKFRDLMRDAGHGSPYRPRYFPGGLECEHPAGWGGRAEHPLFVALRIQGGDLRSSDRRCVLRYGYVFIQKTEKAVAPGT